MNTTMNESIAISSDCINIRLSATMNNCFYQLYMSS